LAITNLYPNPLQPHRGTFNRQQLRALADRNDVAVIAPIAWTDEWSARRRGAGPLPSGRRVECDGLAVQHPRYLFPPKVMRSWYGHFFGCSIQRAFDDALAEFRPELVFAAWAYPDGWAAVRLGHRVGLPVVLKVHGSDVLTLPQTRGRGPVTTQALRGADAVIAVSQDLAEKVVQMGADAARVSVVYDGIDSSRFHPGPRQVARERLGIPEDEPMILFVGNLVPVKGVDVLIQACARLASRGLRFRCLVIGQGPLRAELAQQVEEAGLARRVTLVGPVAHAELPDWYRAADLFVLPSYSEGVPCVLLEAAACQTPFVATRVGGIPEIAHFNHGRLVGSGDAAALADAMALMLSNPAERRSHGAFNRTHDDAAREIETVFRRVLSERGPQVSPEDALVGA
jgi:glycosyltransferase involved in cell wall biosynthesis